MKLVDANVLLYAYDSASRHHPACRDWLAAALSGADTIGLPWQSLLAFIRISTNPRLVRSVTTIREACDVVEHWLQRPNVVVIDAGERFWPILREQLEGGRVSGPLVTDAALAAMAIERGATLVSVDRDFRRFDGLKLLDPTAHGVHDR